MGRIDNSHTKENDMGTTIEYEGNKGYDMLREGIPAYDRLRYEMDITKLADITEVEAARAERMAQLTTDERNKISAELRPELCRYRKGDGKRTQALSAISADTGETQGMALANEDERRKQTRKEGT